MYVNVKPTSSIPNKYHTFIEGMHREDGLEVANGGVGWVVDVQGISDQSGAHSIFERNLKDVVWRLGEMTKCNCSDCKKWWRKQNKTVALPKA